MDPDALAAFFAARGRDLPWRRPDAGAWAVLVSEVMLQQTPVVRVLPVYRAWLTRWPRPEDLAAEAPGEAVRAWGRLGYPRRALRLHEAATAIRDHHGGRVPDDVTALETLPGVGAYTARAVAAFAFGVRVPVVDTNVRRVLSRAVRGIDEHGPATATDRAELAALLPADPAEAATFSAAVMELGALVCTAGSPDCASCPIATGCAWRAAGYPPGPPRRRPAQRYEGTDRQVRGFILAELRAAPGPVAVSKVAAAVVARGVGRGQLDRCMTSLRDDGLVLADGGSLTLP